MHQTAELSTTDYLAERVESTRTSGMSGDECGDVPDMSSPRNPTGWLPLVGAATSALRGADDPQRKGDADEALETRHD